MLGLIVFLTVAALLFYFSKQASQRSERENQIAHEAINRHLAAYLRERTGKGPWLEMDDFYRQHFFDVKCTSCAKDTIFVCNQNPAKETDCIDVHFNRGQLRIHYGNKQLFNGDPIALMSYPNEAFVLKRDNPPPAESDVYGSWKQYFASLEDEQTTP